MNNENQEPKSQSAGVLTALLIGGLAGAVTMLLLAPQSGEKTRKQIEHKSIELRDQATDLVKDTISQGRSKASKLMTSGRKHFKALKHQGQELAAEQLESVSDAVKAGKKAILSA
jgi:gas vesicle protein